MYDTVNLCQENNNTSNYVCCAAEGTEGFTHAGLHATTALEPELCFYFLF